MPNLCDFSMKIRGTEENCRKWLELMKSYEGKTHFYRMESVYTSVEEGTKEDYVMVLHGFCAWSLETCCRASGYSGGVDLFADNTEKLSLFMEAWSEETGIGFQEHYLYKCGECIVDEFEDYSEFWWDRETYPTYDDLLAEFPEAPEEDAFVEDHAGVGGIEGYGVWTIDESVSLERG